MRSDNSFAIFVVACLLGAAWLMPQYKALPGAGVGAGAGLIISAMAGGPAGAGIVIGGAAGGLFTTYGLGRGVNLNPSRLSRFLAR